MRIIFNFCLDDIKIVKAADGSVSAQQLGVVQSVHETRNAICAYNMTTSKGFKQLISVIAVPANWAAMTATTAITTLNLIYLLWFLALLWFLTLLQFLALSWFLVLLYLMHNTNQSGSHSFKFNRFSTLSSRSACRSLASNISSKSKDSVDASSKLMLDVIDMISELLSPSRFTSSVTH